MPDLFYSFLNKRSTTSRVSQPSGSLTRCACLCSCLPDHDAQLPPRFTQHLRCLLSRLPLTQHNASEYQRRHTLKPPDSPTQDAPEKMPPLTRKQSSMQATDSRSQRPGDEHSQDGTAIHTLLELPAELQKTVAEYVGSRSGLSRECFHADINS